MKPNDVSDRAWQFARRLHDFEPGLLEPGQYEHDECVETARAFDKATADLRELPKSLTGLIAESGGVVGLHLNGDDAPWGSLMDEGEFGDWLGREFTDTLAAYTPGESK